MRDNRSEHTANLMMAKTSAKAGSCGHTFPVKGKGHKAKAKRGIMDSFRAAFKRGSIGG